MVKSKARFVSSIVFTILSLLIFIFLLYVFGSYIYEINKVPPTCDDQPVCVIIDGSPLIRLIYIFFMIVAILFDILSIVFSRLNFSKKLVVVNLIVLSLEILLCVLLFIIE